MPPDIDPELMPPDIEPELMLPEFMEPEVEVPEVLVPEPFGELSIEPDVPPSGAGAELVLVPEVAFVPPGVVVPGVVVPGVAVS